MARFHELRITTDPPSVLDSSDGTEEIEVDPAEVHQYSIEATMIAIAIIRFAAKVPSKIVVDWLVDVVKKKGVNLLRINGRKCDLEKSQVQATIDEIISEQSHEDPNRHNNDVEKTRPETLPDHLL